MASIRTKNTWRAMAAAALLACCSVIGGCEEETGIGYSDTSELGCPEYPVIEGDRTYSWLIDEGESVTVTVPAIAPGNYEISLVYNNDPSLMLYLVNVFGFGKCLAVGLTEQISLTQPDPDLPRWTFSAPASGELYLKVLNSEESHTRIQLRLTAI